MLFLSANVFVLFFSGFGSEKKNLKLKNFHTKQTHEIVSKDMCQGTLFFFFRVLFDGAVEIVSFKNDLFCTFKVPFSIC